MSLEHYKVFNLIENVTTLKVLFILESPYINEYIHQHPAAGESALELTQFLMTQGYIKNFDAQLPLGCNIKALHYKPLGILNCSTLPLNKAFYPCTLNSEDLSQVNELAALKQNLHQSNSKTLPDDLKKNSVFKDFVNRLTKVLKQAPADIIIVPCGHTAIGFIDAFKTIYQQPLTVLEGLPHPTEPDWAEKVADINLTDHIAPQLLP